MTMTIEPTPSPPIPVTQSQLQPAGVGKPVDRERLDLWRGVAAGGVAGILMLVTIIFLRSFTGIISFLDVLADALLLVLPISWFAELLSVFGAQAKTLLLVGLMVLLILLGAWIGRIYAHRTAGSRHAQWARAAAYGISMYAGFAAFTALFVSDQDPDLAAGGGVLKVLGLLGIAVVVYTIAMPLGLRILRRQDPAPRFLWGDEVATAADANALAVGTYDRRRLFTRIGFGVMTVAGIGVLGKEVLRVANRKITSSENAGQMSTPITSNDGFYVISKNFVDPDPKRGDDWSIEIAGLVTTSMTLKKTDLEAFGVQEFVSTLNCISNPVGGPLIGTAKWTGVPLAKVLRKAGVGNGAVKLVADADDGYQDSITIEKALSPEPFIVWEMNGENLPRLHGVPVRLIVPGIYGMKNVKWLTKLTVTNDDFQGYWQQRDWSDSAVVKTMSRIDVPQDHAVFPVGPVKIGGVAFAGDRGVSKIDVTTDGQKTWHEATIINNPSPSGLSWVLWEYTWEAHSGAYRVAVRATDGTGAAQISDNAPELPDGASGYHGITIGVS